MSTPAVIIVPAVKNFLYKHFDGYPKATLGWLEKFNQAFTEKRGVDPSYKLAQLIRSSVTMADEFGLDRSRSTGWGVVNSVVTGEYIYTLHNDGSVSWQQNSCSAPIRTVP